MFINSQFNILAEAASMDLNADTRTTLSEADIRATMESFEEISEDINVTAEMVKIIAVDNGYFTEANDIVPFMKANGIKSMAEALNLVAEANGLNEKEVGLLIESDDYINAMLEKADAKAKKGDKKVKESIINKIKKATELPKKLKDQGFPVKKKKCKTCNESSIGEDDTIKPKDLNIGCDITKEKETSTKDCPSALTYDKTDCYTQKCDDEIDGTIDTEINSKEEAAFIDSIFSRSNII